MALSPFYDSVKETTSTTGTGTVTLAGAVASFFAFSAVVATGLQVYYCITDAAYGGSNREVGIGTYTLSGTTLSRDTVLASTNGGALVSFPSGAKDVFFTVPAKWYNTGTNLCINGGFELFQCVTPAAYTSNAADGYWADQWYLQREGTIRTRRWLYSDSSPPVSFSGLGASAYGEINNNSGGTLGALISQPMEALLTLPLATGSIPVTQSIMARASTGTPTLNYGVYAWSGTGDSSSAKTLVASWSSHTPTFNTTTLTLVGSGSVALSSSAWTTINFTAGNVPSGTTNLIVYYWITLPTGSSVYFAQASLTSTYVLPPDKQWLLNYERHYEKSYNIDTVPGSTFSVGTQGYKFTVNSSSVIALGASPVFRVKKRIAPIFNVYDAAGASGKVSYYSGGWNNGGVPSTLSADQSDTIVEYGTGANVLALNFEFTADARL